MANIFINDLALSIQVLESRKQKLAKIIGDLRTEMLLFPGNIDIKLQVEEMEDYAARIALVLDDMQLYLLEYWEDRTPLDYFKDHPSDQEMEISDDVDLDDDPDGSPDPDSSIN